MAKKLIKTGAIRAIKSSIEKEKIKEEKINSGFKRSQVYLILDRLAWLLGLPKIFKLPPSKQDLFGYVLIREILVVIDPDPSPITFRFEDFKT